MRHARYHRQMLEDAGDEDPMGDSAGDDAVGTGRGLMMAASEPIDIARVAISKVEAGLY